jgi:hypothetical protein
MEQILQIINVIATTEFLDKFQFILNKQNIDNPKYKQILTDWNLDSELFLTRNDAEIKILISSDDQLAKIYNQNSFNTKGAYNYFRYNELKKKI